MSGEIDIVEIIGNRDLRRNSDNKLIGVQQAGSALHWGPEWYDNIVNMWELTHDSQRNEEENYADYWHTYELEWNETRLVTRIDGKDVMVIPPEEEMDGWKGFYEWGDRAGGGMQGLPNPWENAGNPAMAPFDEAFHLILNVAVGGTNGFISDDVTNAGGARPKPWKNGIPQSDAAMQFWEDRDNWGPTWVGEESALRVRNIKVYEWGEVEPTDPPIDGSPALHVNLILLITGLLVMI